MLLVPRAGHDLDQAGIARNAAAVPGRAGPFAARAARITRTGLSGCHGLDHDVVLPAVAEVVLVPQLVAWPVGDGRELLGGGIPVVAVRTGDSVTADGRVEREQMVVL